VLVSGPISAPGRGGTPKGQSRSLTSRSNVLTGGEGVPVAFGLKPVISANPIRWAFRTFSPSARRTLRSLLRQYRESARSGTRIGGGGPSELLLADDATLVERCVRGDGLAWEAPECLVWKVADGPSKLRSRDLISPRNLFAGMRTC